MKNNALKRQLQKDTLIGGLLLLPVLVSVLPLGGIQSLEAPLDRQGLAFLFGLLVWTLSLTWLMRLRPSPHREMTVAVLMLVAGLVVATLILCLKLGLGLLSVGLACALPYAYSGVHVRKLRRLMEDG